MKYKDHSFDEKLSIIKEIKDGISMRALATKHGILVKYIIEWNRRYNLYGLEGLKKRRKNKNYSLNQKNEIIDYVQRKKVSLPQVAVYYDVSDTTIRRWIKASKSSYNHRGERMKKDKNLQISMHDKSSLINPGAFDILIKENALLKTELALLKKVQALVEERENPRNLNG
jgi:transposase